MTHNLVRTLARIAEKPGLTPRDCLTIARRVLCHTCQAKEAIHAERRALRRQASQLRRHLPFTALAVADLEQQAGTHQADRLTGLRRVLVAYGQVIVHDRDGIAQALGFDQLADLLSINPAHRDQARRDGGETLQGLAYIARMEDSSAGYGDAWGQGGPLYEACHAAVLEFVRTCPEHLLPDPFAPGAPFGPRLPPVLRVVTQ